MSVIKETYCMTELKAAHRDKEPSWGHYIMD